MTGPAPSDHDFLSATAAAAGWDAFWAAVAASVGDRATTGDISPVEASAFAAAASRAVKAWVAANVPDPS